MGASPLREEACAQQGRKGHIQRVADPRSRKSTPRDIGGETE